MLSNHFSKYVLTLMKGQKRPKSDTHSTRTFSSANDYVPWFIYMLIDALFLSIRNVQTADTVLVQHLFATSAQQGGHAWMALFPYLQQSVLQELTVPQGLEFAMHVLWELTLGQGHHFVLPVQRGTLVMIPASLR